MFSKGFLFRVVKSGDCMLTLSRTKISVSSTSKESADNSFKFDENGRRLSKTVENTV